MVVGPERIRNKKAGHSAMNLLRTENKGASPMLEDFNNKSLPLSLSFVVVSEADSPFPCFCINVQLCPSKRRFTIASIVRPVSDSRHWNISLSISVTRDVSRLPFLSSIATSRILSSIFFPYISIDCSMKVKIGWKKRLLFGASSFSIIFLDKVHISCRNVIDEALLYFGGMHSPKRTSRESKIDFIKN